MAQMTRLHVFLQIKTMYFYQLVDLINFESWVYIEEETRLKNLYDISSIWKTIKTFKSIVQDLIDDAVSESDVVDRRERPLLRREKQLKY